VRPEIWTWGHRNVQGPGVPPVTGHVWLNEQGPQGGDEVNLIPPA
jgi:glucose/arabinose dehydrogenase